MSKNMKSNESVWLELSGKWNSYDAIDLVNDFRAAYYAAQDVIKAAQTIGMSTILNVSLIQIDELERRRNLMAETTADIHTEISEMIDEKFERDLLNVLDKACVLNPKDISMTDSGAASGTSHNLSMLLFSMISPIDKELQNDYRKKVSKLNYDEMPMALKELLITLTINGMKNIKPPARQGVNVKQQIVFGYDSNGRPIVYEGGNMSQELIDYIMSEFRHIIIAMGGDYDGAAGLQCVDLTAWYTDKFTTLIYGNGHGGQVAGQLIFVNKDENGQSLLMYEPADIPPRPGSIFSSYNTKYNARSSPGHTGIVAAVNTDSNGDTWLTIIDTHNRLWGGGNGAIIVQRDPIKWDPRDSDNGTKFVYVGDYLNE